MGKQHNFRVGDRVKSNIKLDPDVPGGTTGIIADISNYSEFIKVLLDPPWNEKYEYVLFLPQELDLTGRHRYLIFNRRKS